MCTPATDLVVRPFCPSIKVTGKFVRPRHCSSRSILAGDTGPLFAFNGRNVAFADDRLLSAASTIRDLFAKGVHVCTSSLESRLPPELVEKAFIARTNCPEEAIIIEPEGPV
jgi:hypothetical protein